MSKPEVREVLIDPDGPLEDGYREDVIDRMRASNAREKEREQALSIARRRYDAAFAEVREWTRRVEMALDDDSLAESSKGRAKALDDWYWAAENLVKATNTAPA